MLNRWGLNKFFGGAFLKWVSSLENSGFVIIIVGMVMINLYSKVVLRLVLKIVVMVVGFGCGGRK